MKYVFFIANLLLTTAMADAFPQSTGQLMYMQWRLEQQKMNEDGSMLTSYNLEYPGELKFDELDVYYRFQSWTRSGTSRKFNSSASCFKQIKTAKLPGPQTVHIESKQAEQVELWAVARSGKQYYVAQTLFNAYGNARHRQTMDCLSEAHLFVPLFNLQDTEKFYRAQTGRELDFTIVGANAAQVIIQTFYDNKIESNKLVTADNGAFNYSPPFDSDLAKGGFSARKDLLFVADMPGRQCLLTFYLPVYRAAHGRSNLKGGLLVVIGSIVLSCLLIKRAAKRFPWQ